MSVCVQLLNYTPQPEFTVASAAKLCYSSCNIDELRENLTSEKAESFVDMLAQIGHESPIEHVSFTFGIEGVSRSLLAQLTRHRIASYSVQSQRYVAETDFEYVLPPAIADIPEAKAEYIKAMEEDREHYIRLTEILKAQHIKKLANGNEPSKELEKKAEKMAIEDARFVLPNACTTKIICTFNARSLYNFFSHRCCNRAQWEIRELADKMLMLCKQTAPALFKHSGPPCVRGNCPEGKMSCGQAEQMKMRYKEGENSEG